VRASSRACLLSSMPRNIRRNSTAAANSPRCSNAVRIAAASASVTQNIPGEWGPKARPARLARCPRNDRRIQFSRAIFPNWHADVLAIINSIDIPYKWALIGRPPLQQCSVGHVTLLGDAFHPTLPILGQGANMAIEDSMILARCLEASARIDVALQRYEAARLDRTSRIVQASFDRMMRTRDELPNPELAQAFMHRLFTSASGDAYEWIHQYNAVSAPV
jgi:2-polyprenyl-6-methoxyphenol hydroxylase-like FAD-dependent oxidoreductase